MDCRLSIKVSYSYVTALPCKNLVTILFVLTAVLLIVK